MRLLFYLYSMSSGGAERVVATLANHWVEKGWEVSVVTVASADIDFYKLDSRVRRIELDLAISSLNFSQSLVNNLRRVWTLRGVLRRERPDIAVAMMSSANVLLALSCRLAGVPAIASERIHPPRLPLGRIWEFFRRCTYPLLSALVAQTEASADWLRMHAPNSRISVIPNPVNFPLVDTTPLVAPSKVIAKLQGQRVLLAVGRLEEQKGFERLLVAFAALADSHPDWSLVILGEGRLRGAITQQATEVGILGRLALPGAVGNVGEWFEAVDLYVLVSRFEGFPNTLLEALSYGVPSVAVDCETGPREILRHEVDGLLVPQDDLEALIEALDRMMSDSNFRARLAGHAVEARERFALATIAGQWEQLFQECIDGHRKGIATRACLPIGL